MLASEDEIWAIASLSSQQTGVQNTVFVSTKGYGQLAPRIIIAIDPPDTLDPTGVTAEMNINDCWCRDSHVIALKIRVQAERFIECNRAALLDYWYLRIDGAQLIERLQRN